MMASGELIALWFMCPVAPTWNTTLAVSALFTRLQPASYVQLPEGFESGIIAACCLTFALTIIFHKRHFSFLNLFKKCFGKAKVETTPEEDQQQEDTEIVSPSKKITLGTHQNSKFKVSPQISIVDPPITIDAKLENSTDSLRPQVREPSQEENVTHS